MTRKRFIKLLMAHGYSRNAAHSCAWYVQSTGTPYAKAYDEMRPSLEMLRAVLSVQLAMPQIAAAMKERLEVFADTFKELAHDVAAAFGEICGASGGDDDA